MAKNQDDDAAPDDVDSGPVEPKAKASPGKPAKPAAEKRVKPAADKEPAKPGKPAKPAAEKAPKAPAETRVQTEAAAKKKKPKAETGIATKPGRFGFSFSKAAPAGVWGIDLGQCALKAIRLEVIDGEVTATAFDYVEHPKILSQPDADPDELTREALDKFLSRNTLRGDTVAISVPGQSGLARFVKLPPVEEKKIPDIVKFEAKQQIPFNLDEVVWDYQKLGASELADGFVETEIGLFAMKRDMVNALFAALQGRRRRGPCRADGPAGPVQLRRLRPARPRGRRPRRRTRPRARSAPSSPSTSAPTAPTWSSPTATASSGSGRSRSAATTSPAP